MKYRFKNRKFAIAVISLFGVDTVEASIEHAFKYNYGEVKIGKDGATMYIDCGEFEPINEYNPDGWNDYPDVELKPNTTYMIEVVCDGVQQRIIGKTNDSGVFSFGFKEHCTVRCKEWK